MSFGPKKIDMQEILISSVGAFIAGFIGSLIIFVITFISSWVIDIAWTFNSAAVWIWNAGTIFPLVLSLITFIGTSITIFMTYILMSLTSPERYKRTLTILGQISFFWILCYVFLTPIYIYLWVSDVKNIMYIFIGHTLLICFGTSLILEIMNNYRHILIWVYGSFVGLVIAWIFALLIFSGFSDGTVKLLALIILLPIINFCVTFFKQLFEFLYYKYHCLTNLDPIGDIFYQIEMQEAEDLKTEEEKNLM